MCKLHLFALFQLHAASLDGKLGVAMHWRGHASYEERSSLRGNINQRLPDPSSLAERTGNTEENQNVLAGFKEFIFRGNVVDLAVGVIIGAAFGTIVTSLTADVITPTIGMIGGQPDFSAITAGPIQLGKFINAVVAFLITALALYLLIVLPMNKYKEMEARKIAAKATPAPEPEVPADVKLLQEIRDLLREKT